MMNRGAGPFEPLEERRVVELAVEYCPTHALRIEED